MVVKLVSLCVKHHGVSWLSSLAVQQGLPWLPEHDASFTEPKGDVIEKMLPKDRPVLILMDEVLSYLVASRRKLTTASQKYLSGYLQSGTTLPPFSMEHILTAAHVVEEMASGRLPAREKARKQRERDRARKAAAKSKP